MALRSPQNTTNDIHRPGSDKLSHEKVDEKQSPISPADSPAHWKSCLVCQSVTKFRTVKDFCHHLRESHGVREGGSFVCRYGMNGVCTSLPLEGVSDKDYEDHILKNHAGVSRGPTSSSSSRSGTRSPSPTSSNNEPAVVTEKWTIYHATQNLSAVLNDPRKSRRETDFFTKTWGESFNRTDVQPCSHLPDITKKDFDKYLKNTSMRFRTRLKHSALLSSQQKPELPVALKSGQKSVTGKIDHVPSMFMQSMFTLENQETFNTVLPWSQFEAQNSETINRPHQSSKLLQEKLSHYLDIVEVQIARQISQRADAFFNAMTSHDELQEDMKKTLAAIKHLRDRLHRIDEVLVKGSLQILTISRVRSNYTKLYQKLRLMATVHQTQPTIQLLLSTSEFVGALDLISTTQDVLSQELAGLQCFRHLSSQLLEMEKLIDKMLVADFQKYATSDLSRPVESYNGVVDEDHLSSIVFGLLRQHSPNFLDVYWEECSTAVKTIVKQTVIDIVSKTDDLDSSQTATSLAEQMRMLNFQQWKSLLDTLFTNIVKLLNQLKVSLDVVGRVGEQAAGGKAVTSKTVESATSDQHGIDTVSPQLFQCDPELAGSDDILITVAEYNRVINAIKELLCYACDFAHDRCTKLLIARSKDDFFEKLTPSQFVAISQTIEGFVTATEIVCGRKSTTLRGALQTQANKFITKFHEERKTKISLILDDERWKHVDVPSEFQGLVDSIAQEGITATSRCQSNDIRDGVMDRKPNEYLVVSGEKYAVVGTVLLLLKIIVEYCQCIDDIPTVAPDILNRLVEVLKMFNSRTCQLVLGAGAIQLVGLKTITTKNLALASRCLQLVVHYIPIIQNHFSQRLSTKQSNMLKYLDSVIKDYKDHVDEITSKLINILENSFREIISKWEAKPPVPSVAMKNCCKVITRFHEAINEQLPHNQVLYLFTKVNDSLKDILKKRLLELGVCNDGGPQHAFVSQDISHYTTSLHALSRLQDFSCDLTDIWIR